MVKRPGERQRRSPVPVSPSLISLTFTFDAASCVRSCAPFYSRSCIKDIIESTRGAFDTLRRDSQHAIDWCHRISSGGAAFFSMKFDADPLNKNSDGRLEPGAASRDTQWRAIENCRLFGGEREKKKRQNEWKGERGEKIYKWKLRDGNLDEITHAPCHLSHDYSLPFFFRWLLLL